ncbi:hypothetical protein ACOMHN_036407 [Nucella lapillus]
MATAVTNLMAVFNPYDCEHFQTATAATNLMAVFNPYDCEHFQTATAVTNLMAVFNPYDCEHFQTATAGPAYPTSSAIIKLGSLALFGRVFRTSPLQERAGTLLSCDRLAKTQSEP